MTAIPLGILAGWLAPPRPKAYTGRHRGTQPPPADPPREVKTRGEARWPTRSAT